MPTRGTPRLADSFDHRLVVSRLSHVDTEGLLAWGQVAFECGHARPSPARRDTPWRGSGGRSANCSDLWEQRGDGAVGPTV